MSFSLSRSRDEVLPTCVRWQDIYYDVNVDFRVVLRVLRLVNDNTISLPEKAAFVTRLFFVNNHAPDDVLGAMGEFLKGLESGVRGEELRDDTDSCSAFCYEFDASEIYASFLSVYSINLLEVEFLHWAIFRKLLACLPEDCAFQRKLMLRTLDISELTGETRQLAEKAKLSVQLPESESDRQKREAFEKEWDNPPTPAGVAPLQKGWYAKVGDKIRGES